jgi:hypothetical protein
LRRGWATGGPANHGIDDGIVVGVELADAVLLVPLLILSSLLLCIKCCDDDDNVWSSTDDGAAAKKDSTDADSGATIDLTATVVSLLTDDNDVVAEVDEVVLGGNTPSLEHRNHASPNCR